MKQIKNISSILTAFVLLSFSITSCNKKTDPHVPPKMELNTAAGYTSGDATLLHGDTIKVGVTVTKTEDDLKSYNVSSAFDGASTTTTFYNEVLSSAQYNGYSKETTIVTRNKAGIEKWTFAIVDRDGNITQKTITLTVQ